MNPDEEFAPDVDSDSVTDRMCSWAREQARALLAAEGLDVMEPRVIAMVERAVEALRSQIEARRDAIAQAESAQLH